MGPKYGKAINKGDIIGVKLDTIEVRKRKRTAFYLDPLNISIKHLIVTKTIQVSPKRARLTFPAYVGHLELH